MTYFFLKLCNVFRFSLLENNKNHRLDTSAVEQRQESTIKIPFHSSCQIKENYNKFITLRLKEYLFQNKKTWENFSSLFFFWSKCLFPFLPKKTLILLSLFGGIRLMLVLLYHWSKKFSILNTYREKYVALKCHKASKVEYNFVANKQHYKHEKISYYYVVFIF